MQDRPMHTAASAIDPLPLHRRVPRTPTAQNPTTHVAALFIRIDFLLRVKEKIFRRPFYFHQGTASCW